MKHEIKKIMEHVEFVLKKINFFKISSYLVDITDIVWTASLHGESYIMNAHFAGNRLKRSLDYLIKLNKKYQSQSQQKKKKRKEVLKEWILLSNDM